MDDRIYQVHETEIGTHILFYKNEDGTYIFDRKVVVPVSEYDPKSVACVVDSGFKELFTGAHIYAVKWIIEHPSQAKMVALGRDFQILSVEEYLAIHS